MGNMDRPKQVSDKNRGPGTWIFIGSCLGLLLLLIVGSFVGSLMMESRLSQRGAPASATVTLAACGYHKGIQGDYLHVNFLAAGQTEPVTATINVNQSACDRAPVGSRAAIIYDPDQPSDARLADASDNNPFWRNELWLLGGVSAVIAVVVIGANLRGRRRG